MSLLWFMCERKRVEGLDGHTDQKMACSSCSSGNRMCVNLLSLLSLRSRWRHYFFFLLIDMYCFLYTFFGIKLGRVYFSTEAWSGTWVFFTAREKKLLLVGSPDNCSLTALLVMMVCVEGRGRTLLQWWQYQVQLFCILLSKDLISDREKHPVSLICFDWQWSPIL